MKKHLFSAVTFAALSFSAMAADGVPSGQQTTGTPTPVKIADASTGPVTYGQPAPIKQADQVQVTRPFDNIYAGY